MMTENTGDETRGRKERSPSFPFIPLEKALQRLKTLYDNHRREPARLTAIGTTWGYKAKSSGLQQTVAALKQFGLVDDTGSGEDRKIQISELGRRILMDERPGAREAAILEAANKPRLIAEYVAKWVPERPSDAHCISELQLDRGFTEEAAHSFLRVFDHTVAFAQIAHSDKTEEKVPSSSEQNVEESRDLAWANLSQKLQAGFPTSQVHKDVSVRNAVVHAPAPFAQRLRVELTGESLSVSAVLFDPAEVDKLIRILEANKLLLSEREHAGDS